MKSPLAGNFLNNQLRLLFDANQIPLTPHYLVSSKTAVDAGQPASAIYASFASPPHASFRRLQEDRVLQEFKESIVQVWGGPGRLSSGQHSGTNNEDIVKTFPGRPFEMPDGWNQLFGSERFKAAEGMWDAKAAYTVCNIHASLIDCQC
jgi:actin-related protein 4